MRIIVYGAGAIGGAVAGALARQGQEVVGIARGAQLEAIRENGLRLRSATEDFTVRFECAATPEEITFRPDDAILLAMKSQDTQEALQALRAAGVEDQPIFCAQNGVANEHMAARLFSNVHGIAVMMPSTFTQPGEIGLHGAPRYGLFDIGRFPGGTDAADEALCAALDAANYAAFPATQVMESKYGKLLMNLSNVFAAALVPGEKAGEMGKAVRAEGEAVYAAAGIAWKDVSAKDPRRDAHMSFTEVPGVTYGGASTKQSLSRGTGRVETDWLNGEIALLGRCHGVPTPLNDRLTRLGDRLARGDVAANSMTPEAMADYLGLS
jgi:2-dehydropantoate 2-reductase